jgi:hypothetical protein
MKNLFKLTLVTLVMVVLSSCSARLIDFTVISTKNVNLGLKKSEGVKTEGKSMKFLGFGVSIKDAIDDALENAGPDYDLLVDGVVKQKSYIVVAGFTVEGIAVNTENLKSQLGEKGFEEWCKQHNIVTPSAPVEVSNN